MNITFLGSGGEVKCYLVQTATTRFLVDCGMSHGAHDSMWRKQALSELDARSIDFVLLTHARLERSGLLPLLTRQGFSGPIFATHVAAQMLGVLLYEGAYEEMRVADRASRDVPDDLVHAPNPEPLYTLRDARSCLQHLQPVGFEQIRRPHGAVYCRFRDSGYSAGSAILEIWINEAGSTTKVVFSGHLGQPGRPGMGNPALIESADVLVLEPTGGDRAHMDFAATREEFVRAIARALQERGGNVIIPACAAGRTQEMLHHLLGASRKKQLRDLKIFVDSPAAASSASFTMKHLDLSDDEARQLTDWHAIGRNLPYLRFVTSVEESKALNSMRTGGVIFAGSSMCEFGRVRHHLRHNLGREEAAVLMTEYQAEGTLGRELVDGASQVRIHGEVVPVRAAIHAFGGLSGGADEQTLLKWAAGFRRPPGHTFVVRREAAQTQSFARRLRLERDWCVTVPVPGESIECNGRQQER